MSGRALAIKSNTKIRVGGVPDRLLLSVCECVAGGEPRPNIVVVVVSLLSCCCLVVALRRVPSVVRYDEIAVTHQLLFQ